MFQIDVAEALRNDGHDVVRASETGQSRADDQQNPFFKTFKMDSDSLNLVV